ncbi:MAG: SMC-Scp complex subunit ScpB [Myxococcales bacterium]|nr:SMC-Scp complex subunit ScpB [Myxococcales bacterium]
MTSSPEPRAALEALIFASEGPSSVATIRRALPELSPGRIPGLVDDINDDLARSGRPYEISAVAGGYQFRTRTEFSAVLLAAQPDRKLRLSRPALETLSIIVYRQPVTRAQVEDLRCVDCGAVLRSLLERGLIRIVGRRDAPGRPVLYGSTSRFLETFGLDSLSDLPTLPEVATEEAHAGVRQDDAADAAGSENDAGPEDSAHPGEHEQPGTAAESLP